MHEGREFHGNLAPADARIRSRKRLPHWEAPKAIYFVTFRLYDSLPRGTAQAVVTERNDIFGTAKQQGRAHSASERERLSRLFSVRIEQYLDRGVGACYLAKPTIARGVADALKHFDGTRYHLHAWCVMPNHVHVVLEPRGNYSLAGILHSWKSYTAQLANRILGRTGPFWQREYYDHLIRDGKQYSRSIRYVAENPTRAGLQEWPWVEVRSRGGI